MESIVQLIQEGLGSKRDIILDANHDLVTERFYDKDIFLRKMLANNEFLAECPKFLLEGLIYLALIIFILVSSRLNINNLTTLGALALGAQKIIPAMQNIYKSLTMMKSYGGAIDNCLNILEKKDESNFYESLKGSYLNPKNIVLQSLSFSYKGSNKKIIDSINLSISSGQKVGIFGTTGSGKSTLLDLFMGLLKPSKGSLIVDNQSLYSSKDKSVNIISWRRSIALVPQNIFLLDSSIAYNVALPRKNEKVNKKRVINALKVAQLTNFLSDNNKGLNLNVGERGIKLSGGQKQRLGIARAVYKNLPILVLDEATSSLDMETEKKVMESILEFNPNIIILIVAHRLSTLKNCDFVVNLEKGKIIEIGLPNEVFAKYEKI